MTDLIIRAATFCIFYSLSMQADAMDAEFRGSAEEVEAELYGIFPVGTSKNEVIAIAKTQLKLDGSDIKTYEFKEEPFVVSRAGDKLDAHSWIRMKISEYRSIKSLFFNTIVEAKLFFDEQDNLIKIQADVYVDSL